MNVCGKWWGLSTARSSSRECSNEDCIETVGLEIKEYERIRSNPNLFLVASGHEWLEVDRVVDQGQGYILVEKSSG